MTGKKIAITGCCGTIGQKLIEAVLVNNCKAELVGIDNNESHLFFLGEKYRSWPNVNFLLCDIRNKGAVAKSLRGVDTVFHCAAYKHVYLCEMHPQEALSTNIDGLTNVINAAVENNINKFIFTSSDKAVNPTNVMGASKLLGERLISAASIENPNIKFISTRFGNVLGSNGSVVQIFQEQILARESLTVTDFDMSRFIMTQSEAVQLVLKSATLAVGGEVYVTKMPVIKIYDLALAMIQIARERDLIDHDLNIVEIGAKPGEKLYEELTTSEEARRTKELDSFFCVMPAFSNKKEHSFENYKISQEKIAPMVYSSDNQSELSVSEIKSVLIKGNLF